MKCSTPQVPSLVGEGYGEEERPSAEEGLQDPRGDSEEEVSDLIFRRVTVTSPFYRGSAELDSFFVQYGAEIEEAVLRPVSQVLV